MEALTPTITITETNPRFSNILSSLSGKQAVEAQNRALMHLPIDNRPRLLSVAICNECPCVQRWHGQPLSLI